MDEYLVPGKNLYRLYKEYKKHGSLIIGFDFDGTVYDFHKKGETYIMVIELLRELQLHGCKLICWTANGDIQMVEKYLTDNKIPFDGINTDVISLGYTTRKPYFNALLDDRAGLIQVYEELKSLLIIINK